MLRYLTHKLRTQSLSESETYHVKTDDDHDSGTESDDEGADIEELQKYMASIIRLDGGDQKRREVTGERRCQMREEEQPESPALDSALPSDSDHNFDQHSSEEELEVINSGPVVRHRTLAPEKRKWSRGSEGGCSSDDEPLQFRTSPPANVHRPGGKCLSPPPPKVFHSAVAANIPPHELCSVSPRKRHRRTPTVQRPCLDFEKMQQINRVRLL